MFRIGEFSKLAKVTVKTLRYYDKIGLFKPAMTDTATSYRYYTEEQLSTLSRILAYKAAGMSTETIAKLMRSETDTRKLLEEQRELLLTREKELRRMITGIDKLLSCHPKQRYTASVIEVPARIVYSSRGYLTRVEDIHDFIKGCNAELKRTNPHVRLSEPDYCCVIYPDDSYRESDIFIEYAQSVDRFGKDTDLIKFKEIEPITAVSVTHAGSYADLRDAYVYAVAWANENGYELCAEGRERYINGAWNRADVSEWLTELQLPIKNRKDKTL